MATGKMNVTSVGKGQWPTNQRILRGCYSRRKQKVTCPPGSEYRSSGKGRTEGVCSVVMDDG